MMYNKTKNNIYNRLHSVTQFIIHFVPFIPFVHSIMSFPKSTTQSTIPSSLYNKNDKTLGGIGSGPASSSSSSTKVTADKNLTREVVVTPAVPTTTSSTSLVATHQKWLEIQDGYKDQAVRLQQANELAIKNADSMNTMVKVQLDTLTKVLFVHQEERDATSKLKAIETTAITENIKAIQAHTELMLQLREALLPSVTTKTPVPASQKKASAPTGKPRGRPPAANKQEPKKAKATNKRKSQAKTDSEEEQDDQEEEKKKQKKMKRLSKLPPSESEEESEEGGDDGGGEDENGVNGGDVDGRSAIGNTEIVDYATMK